MYMQEKKDMAEPIAVDDPASLASFPGLALMEMRLDQALLSWK